MSTSIFSQFGPRPYTHIALFSIVIHFYFSHLPRCIIPFTHPYKTSRNGKKHKNVRNFFQQNSIQLFHQTLFDKLLFYSGQQQQHQQNWKRRITQKLQATDATTHRHMASICSMYFWHTRKYVVCVTHGKQLDGIGKIVRAIISLTKKNAAVQWCTIVARVEVVGRRDSNSQKRWEKPNRHKTRRKIKPTQRKSKN